MYLSDPFDVPCSLMQHNQFQTADPTAILLKLTDVRTELAEFKEYLREAFYPVVEGVAPGLEGTQIMDIAQALALLQSKQAYGFIEPIMDPFVAYVRYKTRDGLSDQEQLDFVLLLKQRAFSFLNGLMAWIDESLVSLKSKTCIRDIR